MISKHKIFILIFLPAALALIIGLAFIREKNQEMSEDQFFSQLKNQWLLVSVIEENALTRGDFEKVTLSLGLRVTLINKEGTVVFDSAADPETLEDHREREEIRNAFLGHPSMAVRQSSSTGIPTIYYAEMLDPERVLRVAYPAEYFRSMEKALITQTFSGIMALLIMVLAFALLVSRKFSQTLTDLSAAVIKAKEGDADLPTFKSDELDSVLFALSRTSRDLKESLAENSALNTRLSYMLENIQEGVILLKDGNILYKNPKASEIFNHPLPDRQSDIDDPVILSFFESLSSDKPPKDLTLQGRVITVHHRVSGQERLVILQDISDREKYIGYKSDLVANVSHELKTPLTLIITTSEVIVKDKDMPRDILSKFLKTILNNSRRLSMLLDDLISLHRLENSPPAPDSDETRVSEIVNDLKDLIDPRDKKISYEGCENLTLKINSCHVLSVLTNLLTNAIKYSKEGDISVSLQRRAGAVEIRVADGGPPIPIQERDRIFERFYSMSESRNREQAGSGLGLSIVKHIAKLYGGEARVVENERKGNTFIVRLLENVNRNG
jgi:two-component system phosphate regulon sensor histidine kinase PhoR